MMGFYDYGWGMGFFGWTMMIIFWGVVIWLIVWLINQNKYPERTKNERDPETILKSRYVKGEITTREYREMKRELDNVKLRIGDML